MEKLKISQMAKLFGLSRQTLIHYDKIGILKPELIDTSNNYRYYTYKQVLELSFIQVLKEAGLSLNEMKDYVGCRDIDESLTFLEEKEKEIDMRIGELMRAKGKIKDKVRSLGELRKDVVDEPKIEVEEDRYIVKIAITPQSYELRYELDIAFLDVDKKAEEFGIDNYEVFITVNLEDIEKKEFYDFNNVAFTVPKGVKGAIKIQGGLCAILLHRASFDTMSESYIKLLDFIKKSGYKPCGDAREYSDKSPVFMGNYSIGALTKIVIPIEKVEE